jgi:hypothetical protein
MTDVLYNAILILSGLDLGGVFVVLLLAAVALVKWIMQ